MKRVNDSPDIIRIGAFIVDSGTGILTGYAIDRDTDEIIWIVESDTQDDIVERLIQSEWIYQDRYPQGYSVDYLGVVPTLIDGVILMQNKIPANQHEESD